MVLLHFTGLGLVWLFDRLYVYELFGIRYPITDEFMLLRIASPSVAQEVRPLLPMLSLLVRRGVLRRLKVPDDLRLLCLLRPQILRETVP
jgi:hypothetical protein